MYLATVAEMPTEQSVKIVINSLNNNSNSLKHL